MPFPGCRTGRWVFRMILPWRRVSTTRNVLTAATPHGTYRVCQERKGRYVLRLDGTEVAHAAERPTVLSVAEQHWQTIRKTT